MQSYQQQAEEEMWDAIASADRSPVPEQLRNQGPVATDKQRGYLRGLVEGKDLTPLTDEQRDWLENEFNKGEERAFKDIPKNRASDIIGTLKELPWKPKDQTPPAQKMGNLPTVADGYYAVHDSMNTTNQPLSFFRVKNGRYRLFLDVFASDQRHPVYLLDHQKVVLEEIVKDPLGAAQAFGREMKRCGRCGRALTDETSRRIGIGPDCRQMDGWS